MPSPYRYGSTWSEGQPSSGGGYSSTFYGDAAAALQPGGMPSQGQAALRQAVGAQRSAATSLGRSAGGNWGERAVSPAMAQAGQAGAQGAAVLAAQEEMARRALLAQLAGQSLSGRIGFEGADLAAQMAEIGAQSQRDVANMGILGGLAGGATSGLMGGLTRTLSDARAKTMAREPVEVRSEDAIGAILAALGRMHERMGALEGWRHGR